MINKEKLQYVTELDEMFTGQVDNLTASIKALDKALRRRKIVNGLLAKKMKNQYLYGN